MKKEFKLGEVFEHDGIKLTVDFPHDDDCCYECYFRRGTRCVNFENDLKCSHSERSDKNDVIFVEVEG